MSKVAEELLRFVGNSEVERQLESDLDELHKCIDRELWKAAIVLIGSLIEAVLYHHINNTPALREQIDSFDKRNDVTLSRLLVWSRKLGVIDEELYRLSEPIRDYRNLIHPRVQERLQVEMSENLVRIGYNLLLEIIRRIHKSHEAHTSEAAKNIVEQIIQEVRGNSADEADLKIYTPIIERYGESIGSKIVKRSVSAGKLNG